MTFSIDIDNDGNYCLMDNKEPVQIKGSSKEELYELAESILSFLSFENETVMVFGGEPRSSKWEKTRSDFVAEHNQCSCCKTKKVLQVHHIEPFHNHPEKELDVNNLITLCATCHFVFGHLKNWRSYNPNVLEDVKVFRKKMEDRP